MNKIFLVLALVALSAQGAFADTQYPTLEKLCDAARSKNSFKLEVGMAIVSPADIWTVEMNCDYLPTFEGVHLTAVHNVIAGESQFSEEIMGSGRVEQTVTNGAPELNVAFVSEHVKIVIRNFLRLGEQGQPVMIQNRFDGTLDSSEVAAKGPASSDLTGYVSGTYIEEDAISAQKTCSEEATDSADQASCSSVSASKTAYSISNRNWNPLSVNLGWLSTLSPTNTHLDQPSSRVDFQAALKELTAAISGYGPAISDADLQAVVGSAKDALANSGN